MPTVSDAQQLALRYAQIVDNRDFDAMRGIICEGFTQQGPQWQCHSAAEFIDMLKLLEENYSATFHMVGNQLGQWQGDIYRGETYSVASHLYERDGQSRKLDMAIRYQEQVVFRDGGYRYTRRDVEIVWTSDQPLNS